MATHGHLARLVPAGHLPSTRTILLAFMCAVVLLLIERGIHHDLGPGLLRDPVMLGALSNQAVWGRFHSWMVAQQFSPATIRHYNTVLHDLWAELARLKVTGPDGRKVPRQWHQIRPRDLERWLARPCHGGKWNGGQPLARSSRAAYSSKALAFYRLASAKRWLPGRNPLEDCKPVRRPARRPRALPIGDVGVLLAWWADDPRLHMMICLGYFQLLRVGEIVALSVEDFHLSGDPPLVRIEGKGALECWMPINPGLLPYLRAYLAGRPSSGPLIANHTHPGEHLNPRYAAHLLATAMRPIVGDSGHALRHTGAQQLRRLTGDPFLIKEALRHSGWGSIDFYVGAEPRMLAAGLARLPDPLAPTWPGSNGQAGPDLQEE